MLNLYLIMFILVAAMVHPDAVPKAIVSTDVKPVNVDVDVGKQFIKKQEFIIREHILH